MNSQETSGGSWGRVFFGANDTIDRAERLARKSTAVSGEQGTEDAAIDLGLYWRITTRHLRPIFICATIAIILTTIYLHSSTYLYTVTMQVTPVDNGRDNAFSGSSVAGLASLAGVSLPNNSAQNQLELYLAAINSSEVASDLLHKPSIAHVLFSSSWDAEEKRWREPPSRTRPITRAIRGFLGFPPTSWGPPNIDAMMSLIQRSVLVVHKPASPIVSITLKNPDPVFAQQVLLALHDAADNRLRNRVLVRSTQYIEYLNKQLSTVTSAEHREALINTLSEQEAKRMAASASMSYSVDVFSPPTASSTPTDPRPTVVLMIGAVFGALFGMGLVVARYR
jgi:uncharacterized protein involved in exopolysaccharide biosynthesis